MPDFVNTSYDFGGGIGAQLQNPTDYSGGVNPNSAVIIPDTSGAVIPSPWTSDWGSIFGGGSSDPMGSNGVNPLAGANPNPTGGFMNGLLQIARTGLQAFQIYENGSTAAATPHALRPATGAAPVGSVQVGGVNLPVATMLFAGAGILILIALVKSKVL